jgi:preprotein translocase SecE subunit
MNKISEALVSFRSFFVEVQMELKRCAWPTRPELIESTVMVIITSLLLGFFVGISDLGLDQFLALIL